MLDDLSLYVLHEILILHRELILRPLLTEAGCLEMKPSNLLSVDALSPGLHELIPRKMGFARSRQTADKNDVETLKPSGIHHGPHSRILSSIAPIIPHGPYSPSRLRRVCAVRRASEKWMRTPCSCYVRISEFPPKSYFFRL